MLLLRQQAERSPEDRVAELKDAHLELARQLVREGAEDASASWLFSSCSSSKGGGAKSSSSSSRDLLEGGGSGFGTYIVTIALPKLGGHRSSRCCAPPPRALGGSGVA